MTEVKIKLLNDFAKMPQKSKPDDAGYDISYAGENDIVLEWDRHLLIPTGFSMEIPKGYEAQIRSRSGLSAKHQVIVLNQPGTIDSNFRGEVKVILKNLDKVDFKILPGDRIAQMVFAKLPDIELVESKDLSETDRGSGGFGSTGVK